MKLEQVLPMLKSGQTITRTKTLKHDGATIVFVKIEDSRLKFRCIWSDGEAMKDWASYRLRTEDVLAENWEIAG